MMNIDERLERLAERYEALTRSIESLARDVRDMRGVVNEIAQGTARLLQVVKRLPGSG